jgi:hypothetical protein
MRENWSICDMRKEAQKETMQSPDLPPELLEMVIHFSIRVRSLRRALRLRLVNRRSVSPLRFPILTIANRAVQNSHRKGHVSHAFP